MFGLLEMLQLLVLFFRATSVLNRGRGIVRAWAIEVIRFEGKEEERDINRAV